MGICAWGSMYVGDDRQEFYDRLRRRAQEAEEAPEPPQELDTELQESHDRPLPQDRRKTRRTSVGKGTSDV